MEFTLIKIGYIETTETKAVIRLDPKYHKTLINIEKFSHIHIFYLYNNKIYDIIGKISHVSIPTGILECYTKLTDGIYDLIDIKPYMPSEDSINNKVIKQTEILPSIINEQIQTIGLIRNIKGMIYLETYEDLELNDEYIKIIWWFDKFDKPKFRDCTTCNPPYEDAPVSGVFATRSPVRPNLIALTIVKVIKKEGRIIYINGIESFDKTPLLGIIGYDSKTDYIIDASVPSYLTHWPRFIDFSEWNKNLNEIELISSKLFDLVYMNNNSHPVLNNHIDIVNEQGIVIKKAYENNLKNIDVTIPYFILTAVIGVSGSGKSSLVDDTIYQECQRKMEYLNRNRTLLNKPKVDLISGILPAIRIKQEPIKGSIMSTVGTYTNAFDPLRVLFSTIGLCHCPNCGKEIITLTEAKIEDLISKYIFDIYNLNKEKVCYSTIKESIKQALEFGKGALYVIIDNEFVLLQTKEKCYHCDKIMFNLSPSTFSYLNAEARCPICNGRGEINEVDVNKIITNPNISLLDGAIGFYGKLSNFLANPNANWMKGQVIGLAYDENIDLTIPWVNLPEQFKQELLYGVDKIVTFPFYNKKNGRTGKIERPVEGLIPLIKRLFNEETDPKIIDKYFS